MPATIGFAIKDIRELKNSFFALALVGLALASSAGAADIYKCTDADGNLSYSQTPCPKQKSVEVSVSGSGGSNESVDCSYANRFAFSAARLMQAGTRSDELFNRYGGIDSLSKGSINIINYVYGYRTSNDVSGGTNCSADPSHGARPVRWET